MIDFLLFSDIAKVQKKMEFQSVLKVYLMTKNGQNMAKMEKIRNMQTVDNKGNKFFCFPMISVACTGSGYTKRLLIIRFSTVFILSDSQRVAQKE